MAARVRVLKLVSPFMRGADVTRLQRGLKKHKYLQGEVDGVFGPDTHRAVYRAKYWLGYQTPTYSSAERLPRLLEGREKPTASMVALAKKRRELAQATTPVGIRMLTEAVRHIGVKESPAGSNKVLFSEWYGVRGPWCAMFVTYCAVKAKSVSFVRGAKYAYVPFIVNDARAGRNNLAVWYKPTDGDLVCFDWQAMGYAGIADHIGFYATEATLNKIAPEDLAAAKKKFGALAGANEFWTVEGNTAIGNDSNGGEVMIRQRVKTQVQAYAHVGR
jgi:peptidoglycan hydrolase-like protein with peptidoglycan-binding domain